MIIISYFIIWDMYSTYPILNLISEYMIIGHKFIFIPMLCLKILYNLVNLYLLINYSILNEKDIKFDTKKYLPKFIKNYLLELKKIGQSEDVKFFLWLNIEFAKKYFILLILAILTIYLFDNKIFFIL